MKLGATGEYPNGALGPHDEGAINIGVTHDSKGTVILNFGKEVSWIGMPPEQAIQFASLIMRHAGARQVDIKL